MIINSNLAALNTIRQLSVNEKATQSSLSKLSSGLRINSAADDAAGLAISEKMRGQISGLNQASSNAQTGINLISTAEGALSETTSILQRMRELAVQASNDTNTTSDREAMQTETNQLISAINDIGNQTQFNTKNLLDGTLAGATGIALGTNSTTGSVVGKVAAADVSAAVTMQSAAITSTQFAAETVNVDGTNITVNWQNLSSSDQATIINGTSLSASTTQQNAAEQLIVNTINNAIDASGTNVAHVTGFVSNGHLHIDSGSSGINSQVTTNSAALVLNQALTGAGTTNITGKGTDTYNQTTDAANAVFDFTINGTTMQATLSSAITGGTTSMASAAIIIANAMNTAISAARVTAGATTAANQGYIANVTVNATTDGRFQVLSETGGATFQDIPGSQTSGNLGLTQGQTTAADGGGLTFQVGANASQTMSLSIGDMRSNALGLTGLDLSTTTTAQAAITAIDSATAMVSDQRSKLGAAQNRLDHTINNLGTSSQNITTAEANIRDVDMASEMTNFQKNNVLQQAAQAMLAQANQQPQAVLQLLR